MYESCEFDKELLWAREWKEEHTVNNTAITEINLSLAEWKNKIQAENCVQFKQLHNEDTYSDASGNQGGYTGGTCYPPTGDWLSNEIAS